MQHFIINPAAGGGRAARAIPALQSAIEKHQLKATVHVTNKAGEATVLAQNLPSLEPIIVVGGDGTLHEVIRGLLDGQTRAERPIGLIPLGTGDDFARGVGIPLSNIEAALEIIKRGRTRWFDAARIENRSFLNGFGAGFDAQVARTVKTTPKNLPGSLRYLLAIIQELSALEPRFVKVFADDELVHDNPALLIAVMNLKGYGGGLKINPNADGSDGLLEIVIGGRFSKLGTLGILPRLAQGKHLGHPEVKVVQAKKIRLEWRDIMPAHVDGELLEPARVFELEVLPEAVSIFMP
jgi:diacylglycerol kinase (ATP)